jgi:hypothetical protein
MAVGISIIGLLMLLVVVLLPLAIGIMLIVGSRRGGHGYPACGACHYNLSATVGTSTRCPECGALFTEVGILPPKGARRPLMLWLGVGVILIPIFLFGTMFGMMAFRSSAARAAQKQAIMAQQQAAAQTAQSGTAADNTADPTVADVDSPAAAPESE